MKGELLYGYAGDSGGTDSSRSAADSVECVDADFQKETFPMLI